MGFSSPKCRPEFFSKFINSCHKYVHLIWSLILESNANLKRLLSSCSLKGEMIMDLSIMDMLLVHAILSMILVLLTLFIDCDLHFMEIQLLSSCHLMHPYFGWWPNTREDVMALMRWAHDYVGFMISFDFCFIPCLGK